MLKFTDVKYYGLPILSGILIGTSYIPFPPWAALFCFVPLWIFWQQQTRLKSVIMGGMITSFVLTLIGFNWMTYLLHEFANLPWGVAILGMIFYALFAHLFVPLAGMIWFLIQQKLKVTPTLSLSFMTIITILSEAYSFTLFDWNFGYSWFGAGVPFYQLAEFIGFSGLSAVTLAFNLPLYLAWQWRTQRRGTVLFALVMGRVMLLNVGGGIVQARLPKTDAQFNVLMVQGNIGSMEKMAAEAGDGYGQVILNRYLSLTQEALEKHKMQKIDFIFWAETAFPSFLGENLIPQNDYPRQLSEFLQHYNIPLITGAYSISAQRLLTNSLFLLNENGTIIPPHYSKTILLAFGEYIPFEEWLPQIRNWLPPIGHFARGQGATTLFHLHELKMAPQICYEGLFSYFSRDLANLGAQFIVNVTNDSWYGTWQQPYQHFYMTLARGVEFRRPVLRVTNTGISSVSLASGEILQRSPIHEPWADLYHVAYLKNPSPTFYQQWFYLLPILLWLSFLLLVIIAIKQQVKINKPL